MTALWRRTGRLAMATVVVLTMGCATGGDFGASAPIPNLQSIAGQWQGLLDGPTNQQDDAIDLFISSDGSYRGVGARTIGVVDARGRATVQDGRLRLVGERGATGSGTLFVKDGRRTLVIEMTDTAGKKYTARLRSKP